MESWEWMFVSLDVIGVLEGKRFLSEGYLFLNDSASMCDPSSDAW